MTKAAAIYQFWSGFGLTAYEENTVPTDAAFPYITYQLVTDSFDREVAATATSSRLLNSRGERTMHMQLSPNSTTVCTYLPNPSAPFISVAVHPAKCPWRA